MEYTFDPFDDGSSKLVGDQQLQKLRTFVDMYTRQLREYEEGLDQSLSEVWDASADPVALFIQPHEQAEMTQLSKTDNKIFSKVMSVFGTLCNQIRLLREAAETKFFPPLVDFGEVLSEAASGEGEIQVQIGKMLPFFMELSTLVARAYSIVRNVISQLASLYHSAKNFYTASFKNVHLQTVFEHLAQLLIVLITLDQIIVNNEALTSAFARYMRMTKLIKAEPARYSVEEDKLWQTEKLLFSLKGQLLDGLIYQNCIEQEFDFPGLVEVKTNKIFKNEFLANIRALLFVVKTSGGDQIDNVYRDRCVGMHALYAFYMTIFKDPSDKSFFKNLWELTKKPPIINLYANVTWFPAEFLAKLVPGMMRVLNNNDSLSVQKEYTKMIDKELPLKVANLYLQVSRWMVVMESNTSRKELFKILHARSELFLDVCYY